LRKASPDRLQALTQRKKVIEKNGREKTPINWVKPSTDEGYAEMIEANGGLVRSIVNSLKPFLSDNRLYTYDDFFALGQIALWSAIECFDPTKGFAFSTYAVRVIRTKLQRELDASTSAAKVPSGLIAQLRSSGGTNTYSNNPKLIESARKAMFSFSIDRPLNTESSPTYLADVLPDPTSSFEDLVVDNEVKQELLNLMKTKLPIAEYIFFIEYYFNGLTYEEIARKYPKINNPELKKKRIRKPKDPKKTPRTQIHGEKYTRQAVQQNVERALKKLKNDPDMRQLYDALRD